VVLFKVELVLVSVLPCLDVGLEPGVDGVLLGLPTNDRFVSSCAFLTFVVLDFFKV
jgi:hypothetical protein